MLVIKMCGEFQLLPKKTSETSHCDKGSEIKTGIDVKKPRGLSMDSKKPNELHHNGEGSSVCREEKRTNSDDESEVKIGSDQRDQSIALATRGLDTLAAIAEAQFIEREQRPFCETEFVAEKSLSDVKSEQGGGTPDNCDVTPQIKQTTLLDHTPKADTAPSDSSRQTPSKRELSPPHERYPLRPPPQHFMHAPPHPGYCAHPHPYYHYSHAHYMPPTPPRLHPSSPYSHQQQPYYHPHHPYSHRHYHRYDAAPNNRYSQKADPHPGPVLPSIEAMEADRVNSSSCKRTRRPSQEGLPIKKRMLHESRPDEASPLSVDFSVSNPDATEKEDENVTEKNEEINSETENSQGPQEENDILSETKRIRSTSDVVTPSPRGLDPRSVHSSSASIHSANDDKDCVPAAAKSSESVVVACKVESSDASALKPCTSYNDRKSDGKSNIRVTQGTAHPRIVHPRALPPNHYRPVYLPVSHHPRVAPHYPSPPKPSSSSAEHQLRGFASPPHHYPYPQHPGASHPYHYSHYYPPPSQPPHDGAPFWHRHHYYPPHGHTAPIGSGSCKHPPEVVSSTAVDGKVKPVPKKRNSPRSKKTGPSHRVMETPSSAASSMGEVEDEVTSVQNNGRCVHIYGSMLCNFVGKRGVAKSDSALLPSFYKLVNFPEYLPQKTSVSDTLSDDEARQKGNPATKHCVMCGTCCFYIGTNASKPNGKVEPASADISSTYIIPRQNKGLCTACDIKVWLVRDLNLTIKWCKGCKNFRLWSAFGDKSRATKCSKCRERQKEKYAAQKEAMKKKQVTDKETRAYSERGSDSDDSNEDTHTRESKASDDEMDAALGLSSMMNGHIC